MKVESILVDKNKTAIIQAKYEEIYGKSDVWLYKKSHGVHSVILSAINKELDGAKYLDLGCGAGRLAIMCSYFAEEVWGIDFSKNAIELAKLCSMCTDRDNIKFFHGDLDNFCERESNLFDIVSMVGVLEHVPDPVSTLKKTLSILKNGGLLVISCPNFVNFRGFTYMTLLSLFDLPMSLADLRQIDIKDIKIWAAEVGLTLERTIGAIYKFAFSEKASADMIKRVPLAIRDKGLDIKFNYEMYNRWLNRMVDFNQSYLDWLFDHGILKSIQKSVQIKAENKTDMKPKLWRKICSYLNEDITSDPYYSDTPPICYFGGEGIYFLRKIS